MKVMSIRLPEELYAKLEEQAKEMGVAPAVLARIHLKNSIENFHLGSGIAKGIATGLRPGMSAQKLRDVYGESDDEG